MTDLEIYEFSAHVIHLIATDLSDGIYRDLGGTLTVQWVEKPKGLRAEAHSPGDISTPPRHVVKIWYELALQLYRRCEAYHGFAACELLKEPFKTIFFEYDPKPYLASHIERPDSIRNMFIGGLTWIFFHELGHLKQEHGYVRANMNGSDLIQKISDCDINDERELNPRAAVISHVTELAADVEAISRCAMELVRHFLPSDQRAPDKHSLLEFRSNLHLMICGVSCALYLFAGECLREPEPVPVGTHPTPMRRLEVCLPSVFERLDVGGAAKQLHGLTRKQLVHLCLGAAYSVMYFWLWPYPLQPGAENYLIKGVLQDKYRKSYWGPIINAWDEVLPVVLAARRFGSEFELLHFTKEMRDQVSASLN